MLSLATIWNPAGDPGGTGGGGGGAPPVGAYNAHGYTGARVGYSPPGVLVILLMAIAMTAMRGVLREVKTVTHRGVLRRPRKRPTPAPIRPWMPHDTQKTLVFSTAKRIMAKIGRQWGKTSGAAIRAAMLLKQGKRVLYVAPTSEQTSEFWRCIAEFCEDSPDRRLINSPRRVSYRGKKGFIECRTAWNADTLRGGHWDEVILDEFQLMHEEVWDRVVPPMLLRYDGTCVFILTPPSLKSRLKAKVRNTRYALDLFREAEEKEGWETLHSTSHDNPFLRKEAFDRLVADMTKDAYRQEIMAVDHEEDSGAMFQPSWFQVIDEIPEDVVPIGCSRHWDLASVEDGGDWTAGGKVLRSTDDRYFVLDMHRGQWGPAQGRAEMIRTAQWDTTHPVKPGYEAPSLWVKVSLPQDPGAAGVIAGESLIADLTPHTVGIPTTHPETGSKPLRATTIASAADPAEGPRRVFLVRGCSPPGRKDWIKPLLKELETFPIEGHDDQVDALSGAFARLGQAPGKAVEDAFKRQAARRKAKEGVTR